MTKKSPRTNMVRLIRHYVDELEVLDCCGDPDAVMFLRTAVDSIVSDERVNARTLSHVLLLIQRSYQIGRRNGLFSR